MGFNSAIPTTAARDRKPSREVPKPPRLLSCCGWNDIGAMKAYQIHKYGGPDGLRLTEVPDIVPGKSDVVVQIKATSLNYRDLVVIAGQYDRSPQSGRVPLSDGVGEVIAVGSAVTKFKVGDRVAGCFFQGWSSRPPYFGNAQDSVGRRYRWCFGGAGEISGRRSCPFAPELFV